MNNQQLDNYDRSQVELTSRAQIFVQELKTIDPALNNPLITILPKYNLQAISQGISERAKQATQVLFNDGRFLADLKNTSVPELVKNLIVHNKAEEDNGGVKQAIMLERTKKMLIAPYGILKTQMVDKATGLMTDYVINEENFNIDEEGTVSPVSMIFTLPAHQVPVLDSIPAPIEEFTRGVGGFMGGFNSYDPEFQQYIETFPNGFFIYKRRIFCVVKVAPVGNQKISLYHPKDVTENKETLDGFIRIHAIRAYDPEEGGLPESYYKLQFPPNPDSENA